MSRPALTLSVGVMILTMMVAARTLAATRCGEPAPAPTYQVGEKWTWRTATGKEATDEVIQVEGGTAQVRTSNGDVFFVDKDRVLRKVHRQNGEVLTTQGAGAYTTIGKKVWDFPLHIGKKWDYSFTSSPAHNQWGLQTYINSYEVVACEEVTTPAGKLSAFKIEVYQRVATGGVGGAYYDWYAPEVKFPVRRQYVSSRYWSNTYDGELIKYERKPVAGRGHTELGSQPSPSRSGPTTPPPISASDAPPGPLPPPSRPAAARPDPELESRLRTLKDLRERNLITEEQYQSSVKELLQKLTQ